MQIAANTKATQAVKLDADEDEPLSEQTVRQTRTGLTLAGLTFGALTLAGLTFGALTLAGLTFGALTLAALTRGALTALTRGALTGLTEATETEATLVSQLHCPCWQAPTLMVCWAETRPPH